MISAQTLSELPVITDRAAAGVRRSETYALRRFASPTWRLERRSSAHKRLNRGAQMLHPSKLKKVPSKCVS